MVAQSEDAQPGGFAGVIWPGEIIYSIAHGTNFWMAWSLLSRESLRVVRHPAKNIPPQRRLSDERPAILLCLLLFGGAVWTFWPALQNGFVDYDDPDYVTQNHHVQGGLTWTNARWAFTNTGAAGFWHPLTWLSHMLDCQLFGLNPWGHHLTGVLLHATNVALVFLVFRKMTGATWRSWLLAALFGAHPLRVESVAWAAERKDVLGGLFWLLTTWAYVHAVQWERGRTSKAGARGALFFSSFYWLALVFFACGLMSKPMLVTLPFTLLLLDYWPLKRLENRNVEFKASRRSRAGEVFLEKIPFFLMAIVAGIVAFLTQSASHATSVGVPWIARLENAFVSYVRYPGKIFYPANLAFFYPHPHDWPVLPVAASFVLLLAITVFVLRSGRRHPYLPVGWFWFLGTLMPVIGLVQVGGQAMADRFTYIPCLGILMMVVWSLPEVTARRSYLSGVTCVFALATIIPCVALTRRQIPFWKNTKTLCRHALAVTKDNYIAHYCLGAAFEREHQTERAIVQYRAALAAEPDYAVAHNNLGFALCSEGHFGEAMVEFQKALEQQADPARTHFGMGVLLGRQGRVTEAGAQFHTAVQLQPDWPEAHFNLGIALEHEGKVGDAAAEFQKAVRL
ncbi:MAG: tetratricopeptide repeat protein, partial [Verrucomicrobia bacterium]|nr:tetratricopeptide repeat protein [Verrucomicrobiota bacterium]